MDTISERETYGNKENVAKGNRARNKGGMISRKAKRSRLKSAPVLSSHRTTEREISKELMNYMITKIEKEDEEFVYFRNIHYKTVADITPNKRVNFYDKFGFSLIHHVPRLEGTEKQFEMLLSSLHLKFGRELVHQRTKNKLKLQLLHCCFPVALKQVLDEGALHLRVTGGALKFRTSMLEDVPLEDFLNVNLEVAKWILRTYPGAVEKLTADDQNILHLCVLVVVVASLGYKAESFVQPYFSQTMKRCVELLIIIVEKMNQGMLLFDRDALGKTPIDLLGFVPSNIQKKTPHFMEIKDILTKAEQKVIQTEMKNYYASKKYQYDLEEDVVEPLIMEILEDAFEEIDMRGPIWKKEKKRCQKKAKLLAQLKAERRKKMAAERQKRASTFGHEIDARTAEMTERNIQKAMYSQAVNRIRRFMIKFTKEKATIYDIKLESPYDIFAAMDRDASGTISFVEFFEMTQDLKIPLTEEEKASIFATLDYNGDGILVLNEIAEALGLTIPKKKEVPEIPKEDKRKSSESVEKAIQKLFMREEIVMGGINHRDTMKDIKIKFEELADHWTAEENTLSDDEGVNDNQPDLNDYDVLVRELGNQLGAMSENYVIQGEQAEDDDHVQGLLEADNGSAKKLLAAMRRYSEIQQLEKDIVNQVEVEKPMLAIQMSKITEHLPPQMKGTISASLGDLCESANDGPVNREHGVKYIVEEEESSDEEEEVLKKDEKMVTYIQGIVDKASEQVSLAHEENNSLRGKLVDAKKVIVQKKEELATEIQARLDEKEKFDAKIEAWKEAVESESDDDEGEIHSEVIAKIKKEKQNLKMRIEIVKEERLTAEEELQEKITELESQLQEKVVTVHDTAMADFSNIKAMRKFLEEYARGINSSPEMVLFKFKRANPHQFTYEELLAGFDVIGINATEYTKQALEKFINAIELRVGGSIEFKELGISLGYNFSLDSNQGEDIKKKLQDIMDFMRANDLMKPAVGSGASAVKKLKAKRKEFKVRSIVSIHGDPYCIVHIFNRNRFLVQNMRDNDSKEVDVSELKKFNDSQTTLSIQQHLPVRHQCAQKVLINKMIIFRKPGDFGVGKCVRVDNEVVSYLPYKSHSGVDNKWYKRKYKVIGKTRHHFKKVSTKDILVCNFSLVADGSATWNGNTDWKNTVPLAVLERISLLHRLSFEAEVKPKEEKISLPIKEPEKEMLPPVVNTDLAKGTTYTSDEDNSLVLLEEQTMSKIIVQETLSKQIPENVEKERSKAAALRKESNRNKELQGQLELLTGKLRDVQENMQDIVSQRVSNILENKIKYDDEKKKAEIIEIAKKVNSRAHTLNILQKLRTKLSATKHYVQKARPYSADELMKFRDKMKDLKKDYAQFKELKKQLDEEREKEATEHALLGELQEVQVEEGKHDVLESLENGLMETEQTLNRDLNGEEKLCDPQEMFFQKANENNQAETNPQRESVFELKEQIVSLKNALHVSETKRAETIEESFELLKESHRSQMQEKKRTKKKISKHTRSKVIRIDAPVAHEEQINNAITRKIRKVLFQCRSFPMWTLTQQDKWREMVSMSPQDPKRPQYVKAASLHEHFLWFSSNAVSCWTQTHDILQSMSIFNELSIRKESRSLLSFSNLIHGLSNTKVVDILLKCKTGIMKTLLSPTNWEFLFNTEVRDNIELQEFVRFMTRVIEGGHTLSSTSPSDVDMWRQQENHNAKHDLTLMSKLFTVLDVDLTGTLQPEVLQQSIYGDSVQAVLSQCSNAVLSELLRTSGTLWSDCVSLLESSAPVFNNMSEKSISRSHFLRFFEGILGDHTLNLRQIKADLEGSKKLFKIIQKSNDISGKVDKYTMLRCFHHRDVASALKQLRSTHLSTLHTNLKSWVNLFTHSPDFIDALTFQRIIRCAAFDLYQHAKVSSDLEILEHHFESFADKNSLINVNAIIDMFDGDRVFGTCSTETLRDLTIDSLWKRHVSSLQYFQGSSPEGEVNLFAILKYFWFFARNGVSQSTVFQDVDKIDTIIDILYKSESSVPLSELIHPGVSMASPLPTKVTEEAPKSIEITEKVTKVPIEKENIAPSDTSYKLVHENEDTTAAWANRIKRLMNSS